MALFMDYHEDLKLPAEALAQIAEDTSHARADRSRERAWPGGNVQSLPLPPLPSLR